MKIIKITDYYGQIQEVPVDDALYEEWQEMNRAEDRLRKREEYHRGDMPYGLAQELLYRENDLIEQILERKYMIDRLYECIDQLNPTQKRRILLYLEDRTLTEISRMEGCACPAIHKSLNNAFKHLRKLLTH